MVEVTIYLRSGRHIDGFYVMDERGITADYADLFANAVAICILSLDGKDTYGIPVSEIEAIQYLNQVHPGFPQTP